MFTFILLLNICLVIAGIGVAYWGFKSLLEQLYF